jgi:hypothetical protein
MSHAFPARDKALALASWLLVTIALLWPAFGPLSRDSFPLSTYPMFAAHRGQPALNKLVGVDASGAERAIPPRLLGSSEVLQAKALIDAAARNKQKRARLCEAVAERVLHDSNFDAVSELLLLRLRYDPVAYFERGPTPVERRVLGRCQVPRAGAAQ